MYAIYVDNFRGFKKTFIEFGDVNFFVGENSTGKTSLLSLLGLISKQTFWLDPEFNNKDIQLGNFDEIASSPAGRKRFHVGFLQEINSVEEKKNKNTKEAAETPPQFQLRFLSFSNKKGVPKADAFTILYKDKLLHIKIDDDKVSYKYTDTGHITSFAQLKQFLPKIVEIHKSTKGRYHVLHKGNDIGKRLPIFAIQQLTIDHLLKEKNLRSKTKKVSIDFPMDVFDTSSSLTWIAPIRSKPQRTYDQFQPGYSAEGTHIPYILNDRIGDPENRSKSNKLLNDLEKFGINSGLFKSIQINRYGAGNTAPFSLDVLLDSSPHKISNVGYGVSQGLPVFVEIQTRKRESKFAIQQPEVHLHPRAQATLGEFIFSLAVHDRKKFYIETHSDYLIDRFRIKVAEQFANLKLPLISQVLFFERAQKGNKVTTIKINDTGGYGVSPRKFREFFLNEELKLLEI